MNLNPPLNTDLGVPDELTLKKTVAMLFTCYHNHEFIVKRNRQDMRIVIDPAAKQCLADQGIAFTR